MEQLCNALGPRSRPFVAVVSNNVRRVYASGGSHWRDVSSQPVGMGDFTVEADKAALGPVIKGLVEKRKQQAKDEGDITFFRLLHCMTTRLLYGTGYPSGFENETVDEFMATMQFKSVKDGEKTGNSPLRYAIFTGNYNLIKALLDAGSDPNAPFKSPKDLMTNDFVPSAPKLNILNQFCILPKVDVDIVKLLLKYGANPKQIDAVGSTALHCAMGGGNTEIIDVLLEADPSMANMPTLTGWVPVDMGTLLSAFRKNEPHILQHLLEKHPDVVRPYLNQTDGFGLSLIGVAALVFGDPNNVRAALEAGVPINLAGKVSFKRGPISKVLITVADLMVRFGQRKKLSNFLTLMAYATRCTPLHVAAAMGNTRVTQILIEAGAEVNSTRHPWKMTPLDLAITFEHDAVKMILKEKMGAHRRASLAPQGSQGRALDTATV